MDSGAPQGMVLGLLLLHINDQNDLQKYFNSYKAWASEWGMRFNAKKCNILNISRSKSRLHKFYRPVVCAEKFLRKSWMQKYRQKASDSGFCFRLPKNFLRIENFALDNRFRFKSLNQGRHNGRVGVG